MDCNLSECISVLSDASSILNADKEEYSTNSIKKCVKDLKSTLQQVEENVSKETKEIYGLIQKHEKASIKIDPEEIHLQHLEQLESEELSICKNLNFLEARCENLEKKFKLLTSQICLLQSLQFLVKKINTAKTNLAISISQKNESFNEGNKSIIESSAEYKDIISSTTDLLSKMAIHSDLSEQHTRLSLVRNNLSASETLMQDLQKLKDIRQANFFSQLYSTITGITRIERGEGDIMIGERDSNPPIEINMQKYSNYFASNQAWNLID